MDLNIYFLIPQNISADLKGPKVKYKLHYGRYTGRFLGLPHGTTPAAVTTNQNINMSSFKSSENIQKKEGGPDRSVTDNQSSSVKLNELAMKARKKYCHVEFQQGSRTLTDIIRNGVQ